MADHDSSGNYSQVPGNDTSLSDGVDSARGQARDDGSLWALLPDADRHAFWQRLAAAAKYPPEYPKPAPLSRAQKRFDADFWKVVGPRLLQLIIFYAATVQLEVYAFQEAREQVWQAALIRGAARLSDGARTQLSDWIDHELMLRVDDPLPAGLVTPERLRFLTGEG